MHRILCIGIDPSFIIIHQCFS